MCDVRPAQQVDLPKRVRGAECARLRGLSPVVKGGGVWMRQNELAAAEGGGRSGCGDQLGGADSDGVARQGRAAAGAAGQQLAVATVTPEEQLAEDAVQDAAVAALQTWPRDGIPGDPRAWLTVTARHKAYDALRREAARPHKELAAAGGAALVAPDLAPEVLDMVEPDSVVRDDLLRLIFTCCHPALAREAQVALALRTLAGLDAAAIARGFLVPEATMAKRLTRARQKIAQARIPYRVPGDAELPGRLAPVLAVVHLIATGVPRAE